MAPFATGTATPHSIDSPTTPDIVVLTSSRAIIEDRLTPATVVIHSQTGKITSIYHSVLPPSSFPLGTPYTDHTPHVLLPGLVDAHVHLNEPGRTEWEGFWTGTRAAAFGGVTTVVDMPLNAIPPTTTIQGLKEKVAAAEGKCWVDVGFYGGIVPGNRHELKGLVQAGVRGFKGFMIDSGVEEFPAVSSQDIIGVFEELADEPTTVMFHAEMIPPVTASVGDDVQWSLPPLEPSGPLDAYQTFLDSRPVSFETYAILEVISLSTIAPKLPLHIVHLSAIEAIPMLREARAKGVKITAETCFHYLSLAAEGIEAGDTRHKCCPPIREQANQDGLWTELLEGESVIKTVVSDHSPCTPDLKLLPQRIPGAVQPKATCGSSKEGDFFASWGGISSVGLGLPILWTTATTSPRLQDEDATLLNIARWCCVNTSLQVGLEHKKGALKVGLDGDVCVFDTDSVWDVSEDLGMLWRNKCSPYQGRRLKGVVRETWVRGRRVFEREQGFGVQKAGGRLLLEPRVHKRS